jgi:glycine/D-amino acid oxidase-like deaminating enzyme
MARTEADVGVVGAGVMGLAASLLLVEAGYTVTVVAQHLAGDLTPDWTSPWYVSWNSSWKCLC